MNHANRTVEKRHPARRDDIGDLVTRRPVPGPEVAQVDPFLFLNHHGPQTYPPSNRGLPFGPHPHRGFETVTFILRGNLAHYDSGGHESVIEAGGVQWMTAGSGLVHAEVSPPSFRERGGPVEILQLWVNLPPALKMTPPRYTGLQEDGIPAFAIAEGKGTLHLVSGEFDGHSGPIPSLTGVFLGLVRMSAGGTAWLPAPRGRNVLFYMVEGRGQVSATSVEPWQLLELADDGDTVEVRADEDCVILFGHADPIREPVVAHGPFVMNTREEIVEAIQDYQAGKFEQEGSLPEIGR